MHLNRSEIKEKIQTEILKTEAQIVGYKDLTAPIAPDVSIGRISRMDAINNKSVTEAVLKQAEEKLQKLQYALSRVDHPEFGICVRCNNPIPIGRILIRPESTRCVNCAQ
jgi:DnaK suppressor protein